MIALYVLIAATLIFALVALVASSEEPWTDEATRTFEQGEAK